MMGGNAWLDFIPRTNCLKDEVLNYLFLYFLKTKFCNTNDKKRLDIIQIVN